jgi:hypothetical protein
LSLVGIAVGVGASTRLRDSLPRRIVVVYVVFIVVVVVVVVIFLIVLVLAAVVERHAALVIIRVRAGTQEDVADASSQLVFLFDELRFAGGSAGFRVSSSGSAVEVYRWIVEGADLDASVVSLGQNPAKLTSLSSNRLVTSSDVSSSLSSSSSLASGPSVLCLMMSAGAGWVKCSFMHFSQC